MFQSAACNAIHSIEQRARRGSPPRWSAPATTFVPLTQEQLASMLGVGRSWASRVIQAFKADGILQTRRGSLVVRDRRAWACACCCNELVTGHFDIVLRGVYPHE